jgi:hypothetical protein
MSTSQGKDNRIAFTQTSASEKLYKKIFDPNAKKIISKGKIVISQDKVRKQFKTV